METINEIVAVIKTLTHEQQEYVLDVVIALQKRWPIGQCRTTKIVTELLEGMDATQRSIAVEILRTVKEGWESN